MPATAGAPGPAAQMHKQIPATMGELPHRRVIERMCWVIERLPWVAQHNGAEVNPGAGPRPGAALRART